MKNQLPYISIAQICRWFEITKAGYYKGLRRIEKKDTKTELIVQKVKSIRSNHQKMGGRKLFKKIDSFLLEHRIKLGRDAFFSILGEYNLLIHKRRTRVKTTYSYHWLKKYKNLIIDFVPTAPNQLWVSDLTYWKVNNSFLYISFITDAYSRKIVGYHVAESMEAIHSVAALLKALTEIDHIAEGMIHHSDRGSQYCSSKYVELLKSKGIQISMTESGDPRENAIAERLNGIMKDEYLLPVEVENFQQALEVLKNSVKLYNTDRPHMSISYLVPEQVHNSKVDLILEREWKNKKYKQIQQLNTHEFF